MTRWLLVVALGAAIAVAAAVLPVSAWTSAFATWARDAGARGVLAYVAVYIVATALMLPGSVLTLIAGYVWGPWLGTAVAAPAALAGSTVAFLLGRGLLRGAVERRVAQRREVAAVDAGVAEHGLKLVTLLRLSPVIPFNLLNYALGLTRVRLGDYVAGTAIGILPGTLLYVSLGAAVPSAMALAEGRVARGPQHLFLLAGLLATAAAMALVGRITRGALARALHPEERT